MPRRHPATRSSDRGTREQGNAALALADPLAWGWQVRPARHQPPALQGDPVGSLQHSRSGGAPTATSF